MLVIFVCFLLVVILVVLYDKYKHSFWSRMGVIGPKPTPFVGHIGQTLMMKKGTATIYDSIYRDYHNEPYVGVYILQKPALLVRDPELIKSIMVTDFKSFHENDYHFDKETDPLFSKTPFASRGENWKASRSQMLRVFNVGKLKTMFPKIINVCEHLKTYIEESEENKSENGMELCEISRKYVAEIVAACAFGIDAGLFTNPNSDFSEMLKHAFKPSYINNIKFQITFILPWIKQILRLSLIPPEVNHWIITIINKTVGYREKNNVQKDDFLQYMIELKNKGHELSNIDMAAYASSFLVGGMETTCVHFEFALYQIAADPHIQNRLRKEINNVLSKYNGELSFEALQEMTYMDRVLYEILRKYPPFMVMIKKSTEEYTIKGKNGGNVILPRGTTVLIPTYSIQRDPLYYPNPEEFNPDRFTEEGRKSRHKYTFLSFGEGPRMCLGLRIAMTKNKAALAYIVKSFHLTLSKKTIQPLTLDEKTLFLQPKGGLWIKFRKI